MSGWTCCGYCGEGYDERKDSHECPGSLRAEVERLRVVAEAACNTYKEWDEGGIIAGDGPTMQELKSALDALVATSAKNGGSDGTPP